MNVMYGEHVNETHNGLEAPFSNSTATLAEHRPTSENPIVLYEENFRDPRYWYLQLIRIGFRVMDSNSAHERLASLAKEVLRIVLHLTVGHKERFKKKRNSSPSLGVESLWWELKGALTVPYLDPRDSTMVIYEENFNPTDVFWSTQPSWTRNIGFRVLRCKQPPIISLAASLPAEILLITLQLALDSIGNHLPSERVRTVIPLSLTCRGWDAPRQRILFKNILRNKPVEGKDALKYVDLVARFSERWTFSLQKKNPSTTWFYRYLTLLAGRLRSTGKDHRGLSISIHTNLNETIPSPEQTQCRSLFSMCPKPLPPSCLRNLHDLTINDFCFQSFSNLMHLLWELPHLHSLTCRKLSWDQFTMIRPPVPRILSFGLLEVSAQGCQDIAALICLLTSLFDIYAERGTLMSVDVEPLVMLVRSFISALDSRNALQWKFERSGTYCAVREGRSGRTSIEFNLYPASNIEGYNGFCISHINIVCADPFIAGGINWTEIGKHVTALLSGTPYKLSVTFAKLNDSPEEEIASATAAEILSQLLDMWAAGDLEFRYGKYEKTSDGTRVYKTKVLEIKQDDSDPETAMDTSVEELAAIDPN